MSASGSSPRGVCPYNTCMEPTKTSFAMDLSGRGGLGDNFYGDSDQVTAVPSRRYLLGELEMAQGTYNPFSRDGYMSPSVNTFQAVTVDQALAGVIGASHYDQVNDDYYMAERGTQLYQGDTLSDATLTRVKALSTSGSTFHDLDIYQINDVRKLFYVYKAKTPASNFTMRTTLSTAGNSYYFGGRVNPVGSAEPTLLYSNRGFGSGSSTTITLSVAVPATGSNKVLIVFAGAYEVTSPTGATFNGVAMTNISSGSANFGSGTDFNYGIFVTVAPSGTHDAVVTWAGAHSNRVIQAYVWDGAHQTTPFTNSNAQSNTDANLTFTVTINAEYQVPLAMSMAEPAVATVAVGQTEIFNVEETAGTDTSSYFSMATERLRVGIATLPFASENDDWLTSTVNGSFLAATSSNYNFLRTADNGFAYLFADNAVHKIDGTAASGGTNGTVSQNVILFPTFFRLTDAIDYRGNMYMVIHQNPTDATSRTQTTNYSTPCGVYVWDRLSTQVRMADYVPVEGVRVIKRIYVAPGGQIRLITVATDGITQIREFDGSTFNVVKELGIGAAPQYVDSLTTAGEKTIWLSPDGSLYCHGSTRPGTSEILARIAQVRPPQAETTTGYSENIIAGAILYGYGSDTAPTGYRSDRQGITLSYYTDAYAVKKVFPFDFGTINSVAQVPHIGDVYTPVYGFPSPVFVNYIHMFLYPTADDGVGNTATVATVKVYLSQSATAAESFTITRKDTLDGYYYMPINKAKVSSIQLEVEFNTAVTMGTYDFSPSRAVVHYNEVPRKK